MLSTRILAESYGKKRQKLVETRRLQQLKLEALHEKEKALREEFSRTIRLARQEGALPGGFRDLPKP